MAEPFVHNMPDQDDAAAHHHLMAAHRITDGRMLAHARMVSVAKPNLDRQRQAFRMIGTRPHPCTTEQH
jgi:hypothetical protein